MSRHLFAIALLLYCTRESSGNGLGTYYGAYRSYPNGDTYIETAYMDGGSIDPREKWLVECGDTEAVVGVLNYRHDFERISKVWCRREFAEKLPTHGHYPYYDNCLKRNVTEGEFQCFDPELDEKKKSEAGSYGTFVTALYEDDSSWVISTTRVRAGPKPAGPAMKCCRTPPGYTIDYGGCVLRYTHDEFGEYFDGFHFIVRCPDLFVMTGIGWRIDPNDKDRHYDWIQCCPLEHHSRHFAGGVRVPHG